LLGLAAYGGMIMLLFDRKWFAAFRGHPAPEQLPAAK
jgi:hypothetical protein